jgi:Bacterial Ig domain
MLKRNRAVLPRALLVAVGFLFIAANLYGGELLSDPWEINAGEIFGNPAPPPPPGDTTPPSVQITSPADGATVSNWVAISACASDDVAVDRVELYGDRVWIDTQYGPYDTWWDSTQVPDGSHTLSATAYDTSGNSASDSRMVMVSNYTPPPPPTGDYTVSAWPDSVNPGDLITVSWTTPPGGAQPLDWIAMYLVGTPNDAHIDWLPTEGAESGSVMFTAPSEEGVYDFRYLLPVSSHDDPHISLAISNPVTVGGVPSPLPVFRQNW